MKRGTIHRGMKKTRSVKKPPRKNYVKDKQLVVVEWEDAYNSVGWKSGLDAINEHRPAIVHSAGYVVRHDKSGIILGHGLSEEEVLGRTFVPAGMVRKIVKIK